MNELFSIYMFDSDTGAFEGIRRNVKESEWKAAADNLHFECGYDIKVLDQGKCEVVYILTGV